jgi:hypothetical protein
MVGRKGAMGKDMTEKQVKKMTAGMRMIRGPEGETLVVGSDMGGRSGRMIASGLSARKIKKSGPVWRTMLSQVPHLFDGLAYDLVGGVAGAKFDPEGTTGAMAGIKFENEMAQSLGQAKPGAKKGSDFQIAETIAKKLKTQKNLQLKLALHERSKRDPSKIVDIASSFSKYLVDILTHNIKTQGLSSVTTPDRFQQAMGVLNANPAVKDDWLKYFGPMGTKAMGHVPNLAGVYDWDDTIVNYPRDDKHGMPPIETGVLSPTGKGLQASGEQFDVLTARTPEYIPAIQKYANMHGLKIGNLRAVGDRKKSSAKSKGKVLGKYPKGTKFFDDDPRNIKAGHLAGADVQQVGDPHGPSWVKEKRWKEEARGHANASGFIPNFAEELDFHEVGRRNTERRNEFGIAPLSPSGKKLPDGKESMIPAWVADAFATLEPGKHWKNPPAKITGVGKNFSEESGLQKGTTVLADNGRLHLSNLALHSLTFAKAGGSNDEFPDGSKYLAGGFFDIEKDVLNYDESHNLTASMLEKAKGLSFNKGFVPNFTKADPDSKVGKDGDELRAISAELNNYSEENQYESFELLAANNPSDTIRHNQFEFALLMYESKRADL